MVNDYMQLISNVKDRNARRMLMSMAQRIEQLETLLQQHKPPPVPFKDGVIEKYLRAQEKMMG